MKITLTIPEALYKKIEEDKSANAYTNIQEVIIQKLREEYYTTSNKNQTPERNNGKEEGSKKTEVKSEKKEMRGRPKGINPIDIFTKKAFKKNGDRPQIL